MAYFTPDSDPEFFIFPKEGEIGSLLSDPTILFVSFTPIEYGKEKIVIFLDLG